MLVKLGDAKNFNPEKLNFKKLSNYDINRLSKHILLNLFINYFCIENGFFTAEEFKDSCFKIVKPKEINEKTKQIVTLKFSAGRDLLLFPKVVTFSKANAKDKGPKYVIENIDRLRRLSDTKTDKSIFVKKSLGKNRVNFMNFQDEFYDTKIGQLIKFLEIMKNCGLDLQFEMKNFTLFNDSETSQTSQSKKANEVYEKIKENLKLKFLIKSKF